MNAPTDTANSLVHQIASPGFTPGRKHVPGLLALLEDKAHEVDAARALSMMGEALAPLLTGRWAALPARGRAIALRALGKGHRGPVERELFLRALADQDLRVCREGVVQLGKYTDIEGLEAPLLQAFENLQAIEGAVPADLDALRRALMEALGKVGGAESKARLARMAAGDPAQALAELRIQRTLMRSEAHAEIALDAPIRAELELTCRKGLEVLLVSELGTALNARVLGPERVGVSLQGPLRLLFASRLWGDWSLVLSEASATAAAGARGDSAEAIVAALTTPEARAWISTLTMGPPRYRLSWPEGKHRRADTYEVVRGLHAVFPTFVNDPREATWEVLIDAQRGARLAPRAFLDTRFVYRKGAVPASSHPTMAAALAFVAQPTVSDVVWDPFVGAGTELRECAERFPYARLCGSDHDNGALSAAEENLRGIERVKLRKGDCFDPAPEGVTLIVTNPPMGRRVERHSDLIPMLKQFVHHAFAELPSGGRLVWLAPSPKALREEALGIGFRLRFARSVDMGGFEAELQDLKRP